MKYQDRAAILILFLVQIILVGFLNVMSIDKDKTKYAQDKTNGVKSTSRPQFDNLHHEEHAKQSENAELKEDNIRYVKYSQNNNNGVKSLSGPQFDHLHHEEHVKQSVNVALKEDNIRGSLCDNARKAWTSGIWMFQYAVSY